MIEDQYYQSPYNTPHLSPIQSTLTYQPIFSHEEYYPVKAEDFNIQPAPEYSHSEYPDYSNPIEPYQKHHQNLEYSPQHQPIDYNQPLDYQQNQQIDSAYYYQSDYKFHQRQPHLSVLSSPPQSPLPTPNLAYLPIENPLPAVSIPSSISIPSTTPAHSAFSSNRDFFPSPNSSSTSSKSTTKANAIDPTGEVFICNFPNCGKSFAQVKNLKSHKRCHAEKNFECNKCGIRFSRLPDMYRHSRSVHDGGKPHACEHCGKCFARADGKRNHLLTKGSKKRCGAKLAEIGRQQQQQPQQQQPQPIGQEQHQSHFDQYSLPLSNNNYQSFDPIY